MTAFRDRFQTFADRAARAVGSPAFFVAHVAMIGGWLALGPYFGWSNTYQLVLTTALTILTEMIAVLIANTQNRHDRALHVKLDDLIRSIEGPHNELAGAEALTETELEQVAARVQEG